MTVENRKKTTTAGPPTRSSATLAPNPMVVKNAIINGDCSVGVELDRIPEVGPIERQEDCDEQAADDRRGDVVFGERRDDAADEIAGEQHDTGQGNGLNQVERHERQSIASWPTCRSHRSR